MKMMVTYGIAVIALVCASSARADTLVYFNNFNNGTTETLGAGVSGGIGGAGTIASATPYFPYGFTGNLLRNTTASPPQATTITLHNLPQHTGISISFLLGIIDDWDGLSAAGTNAPDYFNILVDGATVIHASYDNHVPDGINESPKGTPLAVRKLLGFTGNFYDSAYDMSGVAELQNIPHTDSSVTISFLASGAGWHGGTSDESFGLDNVSVSTIYAPPPQQDPPPAAVPLPQSVGAGSVLLLATATARAWRRYRISPRSR